ncbi:penicillin-binding transpeptidase domain-containing protein [Streptomyces sp. NPDC008317]|uniref:penicillin-binding transpeptidase domain-containing protein n=1 Tax=Streptomyces sp. NPDC008317 TaxID=3364827 RepID=UPI0036E05AA9
MSRGVKSGIIGTVFVGMLVVAGYGAYNVYDSLEGGGGGGGTSARPKPTPVNTAPPSAAEVTDVGDDFLTAWSSGDITRAAALTDSVRTTTAALTAYKTQAHVTSVQLTPGTPAATTTTTMPFTVTAQVTYDGVTTPWSYRSSLTVVRGASGKPVVRWKPSVISPELGDGDQLVTGQAKVPEVDVVDRKGRVMDPADYPSLSRIIPDLRTRYADKLGDGTPGIETYVQKADDSAGKTLNVLKKGKPVRLDTTLDATIQKAAEKAVAGKDKSGVTAVDTTNGAILAVAYGPASGTDYALQDKAAPGSTFKIVTAAALLQRGLTPSSPAKCINGANYGYGKAYKNDGGMNNPGASLQWDFMKSCNTGFILQAKTLGATGLVDTAEQFGLTQGWNIGTVSQDPVVPGGTGDELTSEMIGQGTLQMSPLIMASVAATASTGDFHQPRIVAKSLIEGPIATASGIPSKTTQYLRQMMRATITSGTASGVMSGFGPNSGAKTGSAETDTSAEANGWFTAYAGHVAAAAVVHSGGHGNQSAGPIVAAVLRAS